ncbi:hypothetical protein JCM11251_002836 [Rhodosporidiobolus azoricus]
MLLAHILVATAAAASSLALAAPIRLEPHFANDLCTELVVDGERLDETSLHRCQYLLSASDLQPFLQQWQYSLRATEDILEQLKEKLRFERKKRDLLDEICDTLVESDGYYNVLSENEIAGVKYSGAGLLDGIDINVNPSILSGIFQTAPALPTASTTITLTMSASPAAAPHRSTFPERKAALSASLASAAAAAAAAEPSAKDEPSLRVAIEGKGRLDGVDLTIAPALLNSLLHPRSAEPARKTDAPFQSL